MLDVEDIIAVELGIRPCDCCYVCKHSSNHSVKLYCQCEIRNKMLKKYLETTGRDKDEVFYSRNYVGNMICDNFERGAK
jgi:hypothetical protein